MRWLFDCCTAVLPCCCRACLLYLARPSNRSTVGCCLAATEDGYQSEPRYPGHPELPSYRPSYRPAAPKGIVQGMSEAFAEEEAARIIHSYNRGLPLDTEEETSIYANALGAYASEPVDAASCDWEVTYTTPKELDSTTSVIGTAHGSW